MSGCLVPDVFEYSDYRKFLREYYAQNRAAGGPLSLRSFSRRAGLRSPNYLKLVMDGDRNLAPATAVRFARAVGLGSDGRAYFCQLVTFNQAKSADDRDLAYHRLTQFPRYRKTHTLDAAQAKYHSRWYLPAIRELAARQDFSEDPPWIAQRLTPKISPSDAASALETLQELSLLVRDESGRLVQAQELISTSDPVQSHHVGNYHRAMLRRASDAIDSVPHEEREIASLTLCLSKKQARELKQDLIRVREELLQKYVVTKQAKRVIQVNFQMFPLSSED